MAKLTVKKVDALKEPGMYGDGSGLYLRIGPTGSKSWIARTTVHGRRRELGIGSASLVSLAESREAAREIRKIARSGDDPDAFRKKKTMTFEEAARSVHESLSRRGETHDTVRSGWPLSRTMCFRKSVRGK